MYRLFLNLIAAPFLSLTFATGAMAAPAVVASILPVHSLVAGVMDGIGEPQLISQGSASPHDFALSPSSARALQAADAVFWIGANIEPFLVKPLEALPHRGRIVSLAAHVRLLDGREGGAWEEHEDEHSAEQEGKAGHDGHDADEKAGHDHGGDDEKDMHVWLDPVNAQALVTVIVATLQDADPANAARYAENGKALALRLNALDRALASTLAPVKSAPFVVFHDAYRYFERRYGLRAIGSVTVSPDRSPGARRLTELREKIRSLGARCVFAEPQFPPALAATVVEGTGAKQAVLDPIGAAIPPGADAYFTLMENLGTALRDCLAAG